MFGDAPSLLPPFLEVLILEELKREISEVLILGDFKSNVENKIRGVLEVLIIKGLESDFSEVLILEGLRAKNGLWRLDSSRTAAESVRLQFTA
jgi:hypothetical protein